MCVVCGCGTDVAHAGAAEHVAMDARTGPRADPSTGDLHYGAGPAGVSVPGLSPARAIRLEADVLGENKRLATLNRAHFVAHGVTALNLVSSPGSGKTTLLCASIEALRQRAPGLPVAVIEGDQQTSFDADRIRATGAPAIQVNTGRGCHLDAQMVADAFGALHAHEHLGHAAHDDHHGHDRGHDHGHHHHAHADAHPHPHHDHAHAEQLLFIENVGNLVCPAMWDLGEAAKVAVLSVTEGDDKPLKYPDMFAAASLMLINKIDLLPHVNFDVARCIEFARRVNPAIEVLQVSATRGDGMDAWLDWALHAGPDPAAPSATTDAALRQRIAELEAQLAAVRAQVAP